jgi:hypothetical protein
MYSRTFIVVDRLPNTSKTREAAKKINAEIVQMSMKFWTIELAKKLKRVGWDSEMAFVNENDIASWLEQKLLGFSLLPLIGDMHVDVAAEDEAAC